MKLKRINIPIYHGKLVMVQTDDWKEINTKYGFNIDNGFDAITFKLNNKKGVAEYYAVFHHNPAPKIIAHETVHIVNQIYIDRQMKLDPDNDEPQAYLTGWIVGEIHKFLEQV